MCRIEMKKRHKVKIEEIKGDSEGKKDVKGEEEERLEREEKEDRGKRRSKKTHLRQGLSTHIFFSISADD